MALTYNIQVFEDRVNSDDEKIKYVSLQILDTERKRQFFIDKPVAIEAGKTDAQYLASAKTLMDDEITAWQASIAVQGKQWNPDTGEIE
jgi:hypothetical protein